jgi:uncharacterized protein YbdZ (MbtH family)
MVEAVWTTSIKRHRQLDCLSHLSVRWTILSVTRRHDQEPRKEDDVSSFTALIVAA